MFLQGTYLFHDLSLDYSIWCNLKPKLCLYWEMVYIIYKDIKTYGENISIDNTGNSAKILQRAFGLENIWGTNSAPCYHPSKPLYG